MKKGRKLLTYDKDQQTSLTMQTMQKDQKKIIFRRRRLGIMFAAALIMFSLIGFNLFRNSQHLLTLQASRQEVEKENKKTAKAKKDLKREVDLLNDTEYVEKIARAKYFYSKEGEQVYSIPDLNSSTQTSGNK
ncbi:septum formation initiator family protein [Vagococcus carniphilus]|uniref:Septum formation initiator family protein n=1 Tax=Vagococcus carniphilus TaxID=218144 RepID=A0AAW8U3R0_9ENTE|nr:septum formation initiator family protein [Vagococcus carniphilus]MDT2831272.1 septum formation initiator family protein [Vagococcus carniphilus]MDT2832954.1 septum formation initiator family protein [Vagococcus carniphilus]MDT2840394.1 septum formation initiator family protein [Vagococcus carniphilus]MDT2850269.1 septum formation initiator family protein [Vagococcus carniphilus]MDT2854899.1 septum formation initiator family protein [Vagococcus carniphilus]